MAPLTFPLSPSNGDKYPTNPLPGQNQYEWSAPDNTWRLLGPATTVVPGCYGDASNISTVCFDAQGRAISAVNVPFAAVTSLATGTGITGGPITTTGTVSLDTAYTDGRYLQLAGGTMAGDITFSGTQTFPAQDLQTVTTAGSTSTSSISVAGLVSAGLTYPAADGATGQVVTTDGAGNLGWATTAQVVAVPAGSASPGSANQVAFGGGNFYFHDGGQWWQVAGVAF